MFATIKNNPRISTDIMAAELRKRFEIGTNKRKLWKGKKKGLIAAIYESFLYTAIRYCAKYVYANFRTLYAGEDFRLCF